MSSRTIILDYIFSSHINERKKMQSPKLNDACKYVKSGTFPVAALPSMLDQIDHEQNEVQCSFYRHQNPLEVLAVNIVLH